MEPKLIELEQKIRDRFKELLRAPVMFTCDKCGTVQTLELTAELVEKLMTEGSITIECANPNCIDKVPFISWRHKISISLRSLIEAMLFA